MGCGGTSLGWEARRLSHDGFGPEEGHRYETEDVYCFSVFDADRWLRCVPSRAREGRRRARPEAADWRADVRGGSLLAEAVAEQLLSWRSCGGVCRFAGSCLDCLASENPDR